MAFNDTPNPGRTVRRCIRALGLCCLPLLATQSLAADPTNVLSAARAAVGGEAWNEVRTLHLHARLRAGGRDGVSERWEDVRTGRLLREISLPPKTGANGFDGVSNWTEPQDGIAYVLGDEDARLTAINDSFRAMRAWWFRERHESTLEDGGVRVEGARGFNLVRITPEAGRAFVVWIDRDSHLIDRIVERRAEQTIVIRYADYRRVGGLLLPFTIRSGADKEESDSDDVETVENIEINPEIADRRFSIPPLPDPTALQAGDVIVPFRLEDNRIFLDVFINGRGPFDAEFDSGGSLVVPSDIVTELKLSAIGLSKQTGGGEGNVDASRGRLATLSIGNAVLTNPGFESFNWDDEEPRRILIGQEVLQQFVVHLDFDRLTMTLTHPANYREVGAGRVVPFHFQDNQPEVLGAVDGIAGVFTVDTGDNGSLLLMAPFADRHNFAMRYRASLPYTGSAVGETSGVWARVGEIAIDGADGRPAVRVAQPIASISTQHSGFDANRYVSGNLGLGILKRFNITFDYPRQRITLEPNHFYGQPDVFDRSGMQLKDDSTGWRIAALAADAPAERAGLRVGDVLVSINGQTRSQLGRASRKMIMTAPVGTSVTVRASRDGVESERTLILADVL